MSFTTQPKKSAYVPPTMRTQRTVAAQPMQSLSIKPTKKKEPKKEFSLEADAFPSLGANKWNSHLSNSISNINSNGIVNFSAAASFKKIEEVKEHKIDVLPGWVNIRKQAGKIQYKYGAPKPYDYNAEEQSNMALGNQLFKILLGRLQYERDMDVLRLGDLSEFYDQPTLAELIENEMEVTYTDESESSYDSEAYYE